LLQLLLPRRFLLNRTLSLAAFAVLIVSAVMAVVAWLTLPEQFAAAQQVVRDYYPAVALVALALAILGLTGVPYPFGNRTSLEFGEPTVEQRIAVSEAVVIGAAIPTAHGSNYMPTDRQREVPSVAARSFEEGRHHLYLSVRNPHRHQAAVGVRFRLTFHGPAAIEPLSITGRWADSPQIIEDVHPRDIPDILDIPGQRQLTADVAFKGAQDRDLYAYNTESQYASRDGRMSKYRLSGDRHWVYAQVDCENANRLTAWFEILNGPAGTTPSIQRLPGKPAELR
jgi:hypothetical protein